MKNKMSQEQIKELLGVSPSTLSDWESKPNHPKKNLAKLIRSFSYEEAKEIIEKQKI